MVRREDSLKKAIAYSRKGGKLFQESEELLRRNKEARKGYGYVTKTPIKYAPIADTHNQSAVNFFRSGEAYMEAGRPEEALEAYQTGFQTAWSSRLKKDLTRAMYKAKKEIGEKESSVGYRIRSRLFPPRTIQQSQRKNLGHALGFAAAAIFCFTGTLLFVSFNITGYGIAGLEYHNISSISTCSFILGLVFSLFYFKSKRKLEKKR